ncbi:MAG: RnfABCDGE type electron transport complex subunit B [Myxococcota bacterium]|jgi:electron transport complex protein RnfB|nr:RnfABCDGE type electron transport complex subunit B [Myxococcota bacterium]
MSSVIIIAVIVMSGVGVVMSAMLAVGRKVFAVEVDERHEKLMEILPGANCGGCGYPGCSGYAAALVEGKAVPSACPPGGAEVSSAIGKIMGVEVSLQEPKVAIVACAGDPTLAPERAAYLGVSTCAAAHAVAGGFKACTHGCLGLGSCQSVCKFDAIVMTANKLAVVRADKCTGCGACLEACPRAIIRLVPKSQDLHVLCCNPDKAKDVKAVCQVGCTGCKLCTKQSPRFVVDGFLARVDWAVEGDIPRTVSFVCAPGAIFDARQNKILPWITEPSERRDFEKKVELWKEEEKARKAMAKAGAGGDGDQKPARQPKAQSAVENAGGQA